MDAIRTTAGDPYTVFTPFHHTWTRIPRRERRGAPRVAPTASRRASTPAHSRLALGLSVGLTAGRSSDPRCRRWGSHGRRRAQSDARRHVAAVAVPALRLHLGRASSSDRLPDTETGAAVRRQLCWRDFFAQVLLHHPRNARSEHQARYRGTIRWSRTQKRFAAWCEGRTGYPLVDAGMRQLKREGFIDNRARLVAGSFLTKDLGIDWRWGERWFMRLLLDGDEASNNGNWQWIASVGVDPQPVSRRILNPVLQQARHDPDGSYVRRYVPELSQTSNDYPEPIVDHAQARREALARYRT